ncbi:hypothetical protein JK361_30200 [Streptomyces sp. 5-8]|uniref:Uncharacterized protein n=1 Tax=Streptomyces musisoli TaxID=2802280 RepID=A0ABS1P8V3_9ACTN|nr:MULTISPECIES: hypothetical protein [Streptomyces]MBL1108807.1 hypothetical protein [Streptomyces musisoli]MBY8842935.1 hypothetical protein [Streptomyces sp. SP2-10]
MIPGVTSRSGQGTCPGRFSLWWNGDQRNKGVCNAFDREFDAQGRLVRGQPHSGPSWNFFLMADPDKGI